REGGAKLGLAVLRLGEPLADLLELGARLAAVYLVGRRGVEVDPDERGFGRLCGRRARLFDSLPTPLLELPAQAGPEAALGGLALGLFRLAFLVLVTEGHVRLLAEELLDVEDGRPEDDEEHRRKDEQDRGKEHLDRRLHRPLLSGRLPAQPCVG